MTTNQTMQKAAMVDDDYDTIDLLEVLAVHFPMVLLAEK